MLGRFPLPVEINAFGKRATIEAIATRRSASAGRPAFHPRGRWQGVGDRWRASYRRRIFWPYSRSKSAVCPALHAIPGGRGARPLHRILADLAIFAGPSGITEIH